jgi:hypothetical protein
MASTYRQARTPSRRSRGRATLAVAFSGALLAGGGIFATTSAFAADEPSDEAVARACTGQSGLEAPFRLQECKFVVTKRNGEVREVSALKGQPSAGDCLQQSGPSEIGGSFSYSKSATYTFGGSVTLSVNFGNLGGLEISGGGEYSRGEERGVSTTGNFPLDRGQHGQIIISRAFENLEGSWEAKFFEITGPAGGPRSAGSPPVLRSRTISGQTAKLPLAGSKDEIQVEKKPCGQNFDIPERDVSFG